MSFKTLLVQSLIWRGLYFVTVLLLNLVLSRFLEAALYGVIFYLSTIFALVVLVGSLSLDSGIGFYAANNKVPLQKLTVVALCWSVVAALAVYGGALYLFNGETYNGLSQQQLVLYSLCYVCGLMLCNFFTALFYAKKDFIIPNAVMIAWNIFLIVLTFGYKVKTSDNIKTVLHLYFLFLLAQGISLLIAWLIKTREYKLAIPTWQEASPVFRYSMLALAANVVFFLVYRIDYWFVHNSPVCTESDLGNYIQASKHGQMLLIVPQVLASAVFPETAGGINRQEVSHAIMRMARLFMQLYILLGIVVVFGGQSIFTWLFGESYNNMHIPFLLLLPGIFSLSVLALMSSYFAGKGKVMVNVKGALLALLFVAIADWIFIPVYGIVAAAVISSVGYTLNLGYSLLQFYRDYSINIAAFFRWQASDYSWIKDVIKRSEKR